MFPLWGCCIRIIKSSVFSLGPPLERIQRVLCPTSALPQALCENLIQCLQIRRRRLGLSGDDENIVTCVADNGPGLPEEMLERVFEAYFRREPSRNRISGGIGLGLAIARNMVLLNNGELLPGNRPQGKGLMARSILPRKVRMGKSKAEIERRLAVWTWVQGLPAHSHYLIEANRNGAESCISHSVKPDDIWLYKRRKRNVWCTH